MYAIAVETSPAKIPMPLVCQRGGIYDSPEWTTVKNQTATHILYLLQTALLVFQARCNIYPKSRHVPVLQKGLFALPKSAIPHPCVYSQKMTDYVSTVGVDFARSFSPPDSLVPRKSSMCTGEASGGNPHLRSATTALLQLSTYQQMQVLCMDLAMSKRACGPSRTRSPGASASTYASATLCWGMRVPSFRFFCA